MSYNIKAQYPSYSKSFNYPLFLQTSNPSGGGNVTASINNNVFTLTFNAGFSESYLKKGKVAVLDGYTVTLPNTEIPIPAGSFFADKGYRFYIINNTICIYYGIDPLPAKLTTISSSISINLLAPVAIPADINDYLQNYTRKNSIVTKQYYTDQGTSGAKAMSVKYFDGLGNESENVLVGYTPSGKDLISYIKYDDYGRLSKEYLPVPSTRNNGLFTTESEIAGFASTTYSGQTAFAEKTFDDSPLNRVTKQAAPGNSWQKGSGHEVKFEETINASADNVKKYKAPVSPNGDIYDPVFVNSTESYATGSLYKKITKDEDWSPASGNNNTSEEYINKEGQTILVRKFINGTKADTYYVYDLYGNLSFILPPLASANATIDQTILDDLCYQYKYDKRNRLLEKKLPGKGKEFFVYDNADRLILTQDANMQQAGNWLLTKYDLLGRVLYTGMVQGGDRAAMQAVVGPLTITESVSSTGFTKSGLKVLYTNNYFTQVHTVLSVNYYDTYPSDMAYPTGSIQGVSVQPLYTNGIVVSPNGQLTASYIKNIEDDNWTKNYSFYDAKNRPVATHSYNHLGGFTKTESILSFAGVPQKTFTYHSRTGIINTMTTVEETFTYDAQNRLTKHEHKVNNLPTETLAQNTYNEIGQLIEKKVGGTGAAGTELQTINYKYNTRGWLTDVNDPTDIASMGTDLFAFKLRYDSRAGLANPSTAYPLTVMPRYNGNIAEIDWNAVDATGATPYTSPLRYGYVYDHLNRLQAGFYQDPYNPSKGTNNEIIEEYDLNGNIKKLKRFAYKPKSALANKIDDLVYTYNGNKTTNIADLSANISGYEGGNALIEYDANGNMTKMPDKGISSIVYNYLDLPKEIVQTNNTKYYYRADGVKIKKTFTLNTPTGINVIDSEYLDGFQYSTNSSAIIQALKQTDDTTLSARTAAEEEAYRDVADTGGESLIPDNQIGMVLSFFPTAEGFYDYRKKQYIYQYKDHLGNVRSSYAKNKTTGVIEILDRNDYYPFGMNNFSYFGSAYDAKGTPFNYKMQEQELQETGFYAYKWRQYMPDVGRFFNIDPLTEKYNTWTPYAFSGNRVIDARELEGLEPHVLFNTRENAAANFGQQYNGKSILQKREYAALIYVRVVDGKKYYAYNKPEKGEAHGVPQGVSSKAPKGSSPAAWIHTHGNDDYGSAGNYNDQNFSGDDGDKGYSKALGLDGFLVTPDGSLKYYDLSSDTEKTLRTDMPSDPNNETPRNNNINPVENPEPSIGDYRPLPKLLPDKISPNPSPILDGGLKAEKDKREQINIPRLPKIH